MSCKYNNSMYTNKPPETLIAPLTPAEKLEDAIDENNYEWNSLLTFDFLSRLELCELIKNESKRIG